MKSIFSDYSPFQQPPHISSGCLEITNRSPNLFPLVYHTLLSRLETSGLQCKTPLSVSNYVKISYESLKTHQCSKRML